MTPSIKPEPPSQTGQPQAYRLERIRRLVSDLEQELANAPADMPHMQDIRDEINTLKHMLASPDDKEGGIREKLHAIRNALQTMTTKVEGEVLKDSPYIAEIGRILGLV